MIRVNSMMLTKTSTPPELQLKVEHWYPCHFRKLLNIAVRVGVFIYEIFDMRDAFTFLSFACLTLIVTFPNQYFILPLLLNFLE